jgi:hypothetical protein
MDARDSLKLIKMGARDSHKVIKMDAIISHKAGITRSPLEVGGPVNSLKADRTRNPLKRRMTQTKFTRRIEKPTQDGFY